MFTAIEQRGILPDIAWDQIIDSSLEGLQKPDRKLFELAEARSSAKHDEILFIDNSPEHVNEAKNFGWQAYYYDLADHHIATSRLQDFLAQQQIVLPK